MLLRIIYNILLLVGLILALPVLLVKAVKVPGYANWLGRRLARPVVGVSPSAGPCIWLHALSVGETASALPLLRALRNRYPEATLVLSSSTRAGAALAREQGVGLYDLHLVLPIDLPWLSPALVGRLRPDLFVLVETDFWPNLLRALTRARVPMLLVNGRLSTKTWRCYRWLRALVRPLCFAPFSLLAMQTGAEAQRMAALGLDPALVGLMGNLKYPAALETARRQPCLGREAPEPEKILWVAGSTHAGEEELLLRVFRQMAPRFPNLLLVLAPRRVERAAAVAALATDLGVRCRLRSAAADKTAPWTAWPDTEVMILDTYGELAAFYARAAMVFIGGSLVPAGGHNPLEAAIWQKGVIFGPHMDDFAEISRDLLAAGAGWQVASEDELRQRLEDLLADPAGRNDAGRRAKALVERQADGVLAAHLQAVAGLLAWRKRKEEA